MPLPNFAHLQADPALLLPWLEGNLLRAIAPFPNVANPPGTFAATIVQGTLYPGGGGGNAVAVNSNGVPMGVFDLGTQGVAGAAATIPSYLCNYTAGGVNEVILGNLGDFCFTINLNGCTFGIGLAQPNHTRRVSHANSGGNTLLQRGQTQAIHHVGANMAGVSLLEPAEYRRMAPTMQATVFGIRTGLVWRFYFQSYSSHGHGNYRVYGVYPIPAP